MSLINAIFPLGLLICSGVVYKYYIKIFGPKNYNVIKDYKYKSSRIQLIKNPQENICPHCFEFLLENEEIARFPLCDHHFCEKCVLKQIDESIKDNYPCTMCINIK